MVFWTVFALQTLKVTKRNGLNSFERHSQTKLPGTNASKDVGFAIEELKLLNEVWLYLEIMIIIYSN